MHCYSMGKKSPQTVYNTQILNELVMNIFEKAELSVHLRCLRFQTQERIDTLFMDGEVCLKHSFYILDKHILIRYFQ